MQHRRDSPPVVILDSPVGQIGIRLSLSPCLEGTPTYPCCQLASSDRPSTPLSGPPRRPSGGRVRLSSLDRPLGSSVSWPRTLVGPRLGKVDRGPSLAGLGLAAERALAIDDRPSKRAVGMVVIPHETGWTPLCWAKVHSAGHASAGCGPSRACICNAVIWLSRCAGSASARAAARAPGASAALARRRAGKTGNGETRNRTEDTTIFSRVLYQLSYLAESPAKQLLGVSRPEASLRPSAPVGPTLPRMERRDCLSSDIA